MSGGSLGRRHRSLLERAVPDNDARGPRRPLPPDQPSKGQRRSSSGKCDRRRTRSGLHVAVSATVTPEGAAFVRQPGGPRTRSVAIYSLKTATSRIRRRGRAASLATDRQRLVGHPRRQRRLASRSTSSRPSCWAKRGRRGAAGEPNLYLYGRGEAGPRLHRRRWRPIDLNTHSGPIVLAGGAATPICHARPGQPPTASTLVFMSTARSWRSGRL